MLSRARHSRSAKLAAVVGLGLFGLCALALATASSTHAGSKRSKVIDFEDEVVEGLNKRPLDSLASLSDAEKRRRKPHLYRKRAGFRPETEDTLRLVRFAQ